MTDINIHYADNELNDLTNDDILHIIDSNGLTTNQLTLIEHYHKDNPIVQQIISRTRFLDETFFNAIKIPLKTRIHCLRNGMTTVPKCKNEDCSNHVGLGYGGKLLEYCCKKCLDSDKKFRKRKNEKAKRTCVERYGVENPFQSEDVKEKIRNTNIEKHGVTSPLKSIEILEKFKKTNLERYGCECPLQNKDVLNKTKETMLNLYGVENASQSKEIQEKKIQRSVEKFGVEHPMKSEEVRERQRQSMLVNHGVENPLKSSQIVQKMQRTMIDRYGVLNYAQTTEYAKKVHKKYTNEKYPNMTFGSSWEFKVYDFLTENHIEFEYQPTISFEYEYDGRTWIYHPDFKVGDKIYEVKGDMFFRTNETSGKVEMFCPYGRKKLGEEKWRWLCGKFEAKHQCMIKNNVRILLYSDIKELNEELFCN